jgi:hypothetical protein
MDEIKRMQEERKTSAGNEDSSENVPMGTKAFIDKDLYGDGDNETQYLQSLPTEEEEDGDDDDNHDHFHPSTKVRLASQREILDENLNSNEDTTSNYREQNGSGLVDTRISKRENEVRYILISPDQFFNHFTIIFI